MSGCSSSASTATLSPWTTLKTPSGTPASFSSSAVKTDADGSFSDGLSTNVLPHASAGAHIHIGHHRREVERRDAGDDAERLADRVDVDARRGLLGEAALQQRRDPAAELDHLEPARDLAQRVGEHLAVLGREQLRDVLAVLVEELADREEELGALRERQSRARRGTPPSPPATARSTSSTDREVDLARLLARRRVVDGAAAARTSPATRLAADPVVDPLELAAAPRRPVPAISVIGCLLT